MSRPIDTAIKSSKAMPAYLCLLSFNGEGKDVLVPSLSIYEKMKLGSVCA